MSENGEIVGVQFLNLSEPALMKIRNRFIEPEKCILGGFDKSNPYINQAPTINQTPTINQAPTINFEKSQFSDSLLYKTT